MPSHASLLGALAACTDHGKGEHLQAADVHSLSLCTAINLPAKMKAAKLCHV